MQVSEVNISYKILMISYFYYDHYSELNFKLLYLIQEWNKKDMKNIF